MKTAITVKEFSDWSSGAVRITHATAPAIPESSPPPPGRVQGFPVLPDKSDESFRESLHQRYAAPFPRESPYRHWGLNE
ncbi:MAG: hypothetical protein HYY24_27670 [Verrucomicrobia bacterium]|nr:hypothetical protein [Verrucomicrobiota bacterium]